jgi:YVTN family beta-propeller protein
MFRLPLRYFAVLWLCILGLIGAIAHAAPFAYIANDGDGTVSVIDTATNTVIGAPIAVGGSPFAIVINPAGTRVYVPNLVGTTVSVIDTATNSGRHRRHYVGPAQERLSRRRAIAAHNA